MHSSARHIYLIIGSILFVFGFLLFLFGPIEGKSLLFSGGMFGAGVYLVYKGIKNPETNRNRLPDIRGKYKDSIKQESKNDEIH
ncbi:MAG: hypothetical protein H6598_01475 [Flavobacteriales bacterium]|nr:hypothetical protein [Flavobacteriales bacterium]